MRLHRWKSRWTFPALPKPPSVPMRGLEGLETRPSPYRWSLRVRMRLHRWKSHWTFPAVPQPPSPTVHNLYILRCAPHPCTWMCPQEHIPRGQSWRTTPLLPLAAPLLQN
ncbi:unnamed protein product [Staurois parvus]|uniref:Uncharacterized protein n=1 Tax=Staurois parvus TaxID=386267 RepID=A0ABN9E5X6_9NEOB|nr:unnamed protein product [Staurois parvus]